MINTIKFSNEYKENVVTNKKMAESIGAVHTHTHTHRYSYRRKQMHH